MGSSPITRTMKKAREGVLFSMISVPCGHGWYTCWYDICFADDIRFAYSGTDIYRICEANISYGVSRISYRVSDISLLCFLVGSNPHQNFAVASFLLPLDMKKAREGVLFSMISVPCGHGWYTCLCDICFADDIRFAYLGTDIISYLQSKYIIRHSRISYCISDISLAICSCRFNSTSEFCDDIFFAVTLQNKNPFSKEDGFFVLYSSIFMLHSTWKSTKPFTNIEFNTRYRYTVSRCG